LQDPLPTQGLAHLNHGSPIGGDRKNGLDAQGAGQPGLTLPHPARRQKPVELVYGEDHPGLPPDTVQLLHDLHGGEGQLRQLGSLQDQEPLQEAGSQAVHQMNPGVLEAVGCCFRRAERPGQVRAHDDPHDLLGLLGGSAISLQESSRCGLRGGWKHTPVLQGAVEIFRRDVHSVPQGLLALHQDHGHNLDTVSPDDLLRKVRSTVGDDTHGATSQGQMPAGRPLSHGMLGLHVLGFVGGQGAQGLQVGENRLGLVGVHMNLQHAVGSNDDEGIPTLPQMLPDLTLFRKVVPPDQGFGAEAIALCFLGILH